jgi:hypothetical protein|tara:strand:- start:1347 stop:1832 length:486 start_codon:yes stop_codon:yes gene_type:complete
MSNRDNHAPRDTTTGKVNEDSIKKFLIENFSGSVFPQAIVGTQFKTKKQHIVDVLLGGEAYKKKPTAKRWISEHKGGILVSVKYQKIEGTAEEKIPFEFWKLKDAIDKYGYESAVIVLCGDSGWTLKQEYLDLETKAHFESVYPGVTIVDEETFRQQLTTN